MSEKITLSKLVLRKQVEDDLKVCFPDNFVKRNIFGNIILHEDSRIFTSISVRGDCIKVRADQRLGDFLILLIGGSMGTTPMAVEPFAEIRKSKKETEQKYSGWVKTKYKVT